MKKFTILHNCLEAGVVAVVRGASQTEAYQTSAACIKGGVKSIEVAFTSPHADLTIAQLSETYASDSEVTIGAGTVLDPATARIAIIAGASFIVSPTFNPDVAKLCNLYQIPYLPGCMTVKEIQTAMEAGVDIVKVFPGNVVGQNFISAVKAPLPQANLMPSGGVSLENMASWFAKGVVMVSAGSNLVGPAANGDFEQVTANAQAYHAEFLKIKAQKA